MPAACSAAPRLSTVGMRPRSVGVSRIVTIISELAARRQSQREEVRLIRRLQPVYRGGTIERYRRAEQVSPQSSGVAATRLPRKGRGQAELPGGDEVKLSGRPRRSAGIRPQTPMAAVARSLAFPDSTRFESSKARVCPPLLLPGCQCQILLGIGQKRRPKREIRGSTTNTTRKADRGWLPRGGLSSVWARSRHAQTRRKSPAMSRRADVPSGHDCGRFSDRPVGAPNLSNHQNLIDVPNNPRGEPRVSYARTKDVTIEVNACLGSPIRE